MPNTNLLEENIKKNPLLFTDMEVNQQATSGGKKQTKKKGGNKKQKKTKSSNIFKK